MYRNLERSSPVSVKKKEPKLVRGEGDTRDDYVPILVLVLFVDAAHERGGRREDLVDEDEDGLLWRELDSLADDVDELAYCQIRRHQVLLLVDSRDVRLLDLLADDLQGHGGLAKLPRACRDQTVRNSEGAEKRRARGYRAKVGKVACSTR